ncbi:MAG: type II toxin-antitoxin system VapB family antitoxin [Dehalococcoidia bacterium]
MPQLTVRDVSEETVQELRAAAAERGLSMNAVVRDALCDYLEERRRKQRGDEVLARMDAIAESIRRKYGGDLSDSAPLIRADRDQGW